MTNKRFYQIGELCKETGLTHSTIRFWEDKFRAVRPMRTSGGHRYYSSEQLNIFLYLKKLLYEDKYTIEGAKKKLAEDLKTVNFSSNCPEDNKLSNNLDESDMLKTVKKELEDILLMLR